jgi:lipopolysaccharide/colanic/teichoic acid biosynthesis glycosyltransferase
MEAQQKYGLEQCVMAQAQDASLELTQTHQQRWSYFVCKRLLDILIAGIMLVALAPLMLVIAALVKLDSPGPAIFKQERVGARRRTNGRRGSWDIETFTFYKFRSMRQDADPGIHRAFVSALIHQDEEQMAALQRGCNELTAQPRQTRPLPVLRGRRSRLETQDDEGLSAKKLVHDPRITHLGRILRQSSLDELPQLWNVLSGEMSLVGPRPDLPYSVAAYKPWHLERLNTKPGITGLWQVKGRSQVSFEEFVAMDIEYVRSQSLWLDLKILLLTIPAVLSRRGAA